MARVRYTYRVLHIFPDTPFSVDFSFIKRLHLTTKFGMLGVLGIGNLHKKFCSSISKIVDFFLMSNFCQSLFCFLFRVIISKSQTLKKIHNFGDRATKFFVHFLNSQNPKYTKFEIKNLSFGCLILSTSLDLVDLVICVNFEKYNFYVF